MAKAQKKKQSAPEVLNIFNYRGFKIREVFNRKTQRREFKARFQFNNKEFYLTDDRRKNLESLIDETLAQERRRRLGFETTALESPTVAELFAAHRQRVEKERNRKKLNRFDLVSEKFLEILPADFRINELRQNHFQQFIDRRLSEINTQSGKNLLPETVNKDLSALSVAFKNASMYFSQLDGAAAVEVPKAKVKKDRRRERLVKPVGELDLLLEFLRRPHRNPMTEAARRRIADNLEIKYLTGLRRVEVAILEKSQYRADESALRNVKRMKTDSITPFFPLTRRAVEVIESRLELNSKWIFSTNGKPNESDYKTLKRICAELNIPYGAFTDGGFVSHDLRHNFSTEIIRVTDIETAKSLTGHTGNHILTYLHTDEKRMREAMNRREGVDVKEVLTSLYNEIKNGNMELRTFLERAEILIKNG